MRKSVASNKKRSTNSLDWRMIYKTKYFGCTVRPTLVLFETKFGKIRRWVDWSIYISTVQSTVTVHNHWRARWLECFHERQNIVLWAALRAGSQRYLHIKNVPWHVGQPQWLSQYCSAPGTYRRREWRIKFSNGSVAQWLCTLPHPTRHPQRRMARFTELTDHDEMHGWCKHRLFIIPKAFVSNRSQFNSEFIHYFSSSPGLATTASTVNLVGLLCRELKTHRWLESFKRQETVILMPKPKLISSTNLLINAAEPTQLGAINSKLRAS